MSLEEWHIEETSARRAIEKRVPNHPILKVFFCSTYKAVEAYWKVLRELDFMDGEWRKNNEGS